MRRILSLVLVLFLLPSVAALSTYNRYEPCSLSRSSCDIEVDAQARTILITIDANNLIMNRNHFNLRFTSVHISRSRNVRYMLDNPVSLCEQLSFGPTITNLSVMPFPVSDSNTLIIKGEDCLLSEDTWLRTRFQVSYDHTLTAVSSERKANHLYGNIQTFVQSADFEERERMNMMFYRYIPLVIIALITLLGLRRVKR